METLKALLDLQNVKAATAYNAYRASANGSREFAKILANTYHYLQYSVPTMLAVAEHCDDKDMSALLQAAAAEEIDHDKEILHNIAILGYEHTEFEISPHIHRFVERQEGILQEKDAVSTLLGHMIVLEGLHPALPDVDNLVSSFGVDKNAASCFYTHAIADEGHADALLSMLRQPCVNSRTAVVSAIFVAKLFEDHWHWMTKNIG